MRTVLGFMHAFSQHICTVHELCTDPGVSFPMLCELRPLAGRGGRSLQVAPGATRRGSQQQGCEVAEAEHGHCFAEKLLLL